MRPIVLGTVLIAACLSVVGCTTFHSSSIAGYETIQTPIPAAGERLVGGDLKASSLQGLFTRDATWFGQGSLFLTQPVFATGPVRGLVRVAGSGYVADTRVYDNPFTSDEDSAHADYLGWGILGHLQPTLVVGGPGFDLALGWNLVANREFGDYSRFRHSFGEAPSSSTVRVNLSPHDTTLTSMAQANFQWSWGEGQALGVGLGAGQVFFDWPASDRGAGTTEVSLLWKFGKAWTWGAWQVTEDLNNGVAVGWGWGF